MLYLHSARDHNWQTYSKGKYNIQSTITTSYHPDNANHATLSLLIYTCATKGVMMPPILADAEQNPMAAALTLVGYTSGVYTYTAWNTPIAKARIRNRNKVMTSLQGETKNTYSLKVHIMG